MLELCVYLRAGRNQGGYGLPDIWEVAGPIGRDVQERARYSFSVNDPRPCQTGIVVQQTFEFFEIAIVDRSNNRDRSRVAGRNVQHNSLRIRLNVSGFD